MFLPISRGSLRTRNPVKKVQVRSTERLAADPSYIRGSSPVRLLLFPAEDADGTGEAFEGYN